MIDLHCHILPFIDDGPATWEESIALARVLEAEGVTQAAATPHSYGGSTPSEIRKLTLECQARVEANGLALKVIPGTEILYGDNIIQRIEAGDNLTQHLNLCGFRSGDPHRTAGGGQPLFQAFRHWTPQTASTRKSSVSRQRSVRFRVFAFCSRPASVLVGRGRYDRFVHKFDSLASQFSAPLADRMVLPFDAYDHDGGGQQAWDAVRDLGVNTDF